MCVDEGKHSQQTLSLDARLRHFNESLVLVSACALVGSYSYYKNHGSEQIEGSHEE